MTRTARTPKYNRFAGVAGLADDPDGQVGPDEQQRRAGHDRDGDPVGRRPGSRRRPFVEQPRAQDHHGGREEVAGAPVHAIGAAPGVGDAELESHRQRRHRQDDGRDDHPLDDLALEDLGHVLPHDLREGLGERPEREGVEPSVRIEPLAGEVGEGLLHRFAEAILEGPRVEAEQSGIPAPISANGPIRCHRRRRSARSASPGRPRRRRGIGPLRPRAPSARAR